MHVFHSTPGLIDIAAFTTFGINAKPCAANPIGYFGTGLKYAVAVLVREGYEVTVWRGTEPYVFFSKVQDFRGKEFQRVYMKRQRGATARWMAQELPFTTELGKNWKTWMALRELHSNTLDEGGSTLVPDRVLDLEAALEHYVSSDRTLITVKGEGYVDAARRIHEVFLPHYDAKAPGDVQVFKEESHYGYYRGLRARTLPHPSLLTWCIKASLELTEDRTMLHPFMMDYHVARHVMTSTDSELIETVLRAEDDTYEASLNFSHEVTVTPEFLAMARRYPKNKTVFTVIDREARKEAARQTPTEDWRKKLANLLTNGDLEKAQSIIADHRASLSVILREDIERHPEVRQAEPAEEDDEVIF